LYNYSRFGLFFHRPTVVLENVIRTYSLEYTDIYIYILDAVPPIHVVSSHVATDKLTTANGGTFTSSSASLSSQSR